MKRIQAVFTLLLVSTSSVYGAAVEIASVTGKVASGISNCSITKTGSDSWKVALSLNWLAIAGTPPVASFEQRTGRGFLIFQYDSNGKAIKAYFPAADITMNGYTPTGYNEGNFSSVNGYLTYGFSNSAGWNNYEPHSASVVANIKHADVAIVAMIPANVYKYGMVYDQAGAVYFAAAQATSACQLMDNPNAPPVMVNLTMNAPDWNLGEIATGKQKKVLTNTADRLCISYLSTESSGKDFIVNATNANGIVNNRFVLKHSLNATSVLPYTLTLDNMGKQILLPNINNSTIRFDGSGNQTCFTPTFDLYGSDDQELGDYTDVITYEIVTKS
ncbi:hypothetical protein [Serratia aquatilis]|uniref:Fimbrial protein n=1 Tax=Serratia aquatilis TaxID=1737515 RepID=A0ABV6EBD5_9GAMM